MNLYRNPWTFARGQMTVRVFQGAAVQSEGPLEKHETNRRYNYASDCRYSRKEGPLCHIPLGLKVALGAPLLPIGICVGFWGLVREKEYSALATLRSILTVLAGATISTIGALVIVA